MPPRNKSMEGNQSRTPSNTLWLGNLSPEVTDTDLKDLFTPHNALNCVVSYSFRTYALVFFKLVEDAKAAMNALQGTSLRGISIRIEFARPDHLVDYGQSQARPQYSWPSIGRNNQPSKILWVGFPPSFQIDEQLLHNAMILFGEIERIKSFPSGHYSIVEFRSVDEAQRAKEGLQGQLFDDPRITITYASSDLVPGKDYPDFYPGSKGPIPDAVLNEKPFLPLQMHLFGSNRPMVPNSFRGQLPPGGIVGPNVPMRPFGPQGLEPLISGPDFNEMGTIHKFQNVCSKSQMGPNWDRPSPPAPGILPSPLPGIRHPTRITSGPLDVLEMNSMPRDSKRSRIDGALPIGDAAFPRNIDDHGLGLQQTYATDPVFDGCGSGPKTQFGPVHNRITAGVTDSVQHGIDYIWRGSIAKGGTPVCHARCVPIGKGIRAELPDVVDCAARMELNTLTKYYADAVGFYVVFFLPDSEEDFASYTEFLRYLKRRNCAGVAKLVDNGTIFLVPPSDFLTKVLKVIGPERLYGVVLKIPQVSSSTPVKQSMPLPSPSPQFTQQFPPSQARYVSISAKEEQVLPMDYNRLLDEDSKLPPKPLDPTTSGPHLVHSVPSGHPSANTASTSQGGVTLTPELIATLTSLLPVTTQSFSTGGSNTTVGSSTGKPPLPPVAINGNQPHFWKQDHQNADPPSHPSQQFGSMYNIRGSFQSYPPASTTEHPAQVISASSHFHYTDSNMQQQGTVSSRPVNDFVIPFQSGQVAVSSQVSHQYQVEASHSTQKGYGVVQGTDVSVLCSSKEFQQPNNFIASSSQNHIADSQQQTADPPSHPSQQFGSMYNIHGAQYQSYPPASMTEHPTQMISASSHFQYTDSNMQQQVTVSSRPMNDFVIPFQSGQVAVSSQVSHHYQVEASHSTQKGYGVVQGTDVSVLCSSKEFQQPNNFIASSSQNHFADSQQQTADPPSHPSQQFGSMYNIHGAQYPPASTTEHPAQMISASSHFQYTDSNMQQQGTVSSRPMNDFVIPFQSGQVAVSSQVSHQYQVEASHSTQKGYGVVQGTDVSVICSSKEFQHPNNFIASSSQNHIADSQQQIVTPYTVDKNTPEPPNQQHQPAFSGIGQGMSELEADKNQRYQTAVQFAANLLFKIQQQQTEGRHGPGN